MMRITSTQNPRVKQAVRLRRPDQRQHQGRMLIDGARELRRAIVAGARLLEVFVCNDLATSVDAQAVLAQLAEAHAPVYEVTPPVFAKLAFGDRQDGVVAVAEMPRRVLGEIALGPDALVAVLEGVEKPGNLGAVLRSADAAGVSALIAADSRTDLYNPNVIRASLGTIFALPVAEATTQQTLDWLRTQRLAIYAARVEATTLYWDADFRQPCAIVLGSEACGLSVAWDAEDVTAVRLPMLGVADSLNVSAAAAALFYEARRQRALTQRPAW